MGSFYTYTYVHIKSRQVITSDPLLNMPGSDTQRILERNFGSVPRAVLTLLQRLCVKKSSFLGRFWSKNGRFRSQTRCKGRGL